MRWAQEFGRFSIVGVIANALGLAAFIVLNWMGLSAASAILLVYPVGALVTYCGNKRLTFGHTGEWIASGQRFILMQFGGLLINISMHWVFGDKCGFPAVYIQVAAVFVVAIYGYLVMRFYVFPPEESGGLGVK